MLEILLLTIPETLVLFLFLIIAADYNLLKSMNGKTYLKALITFAVMVVGTYFIQKVFDYSDELKLLAGILFVSITWLIAFCKITPKRIIQVVTGTAFAFLIMLLTEAYIPIYFMLAMQSKDILADITTQFYFSIPSRIIQGVLLYLVYRHQVKIYDYGNMGLKALAYTVETIANTGASVASWFWVYQPREPKKYRR